MILITMQEVKIMNREMRRHPSHPLLPRPESSKTRIQDEKMKKANTAAKSQKKKTKGKV